MATLMANVLPQANCIPTKLAAKNKRGEFIEMAELLPGCWSSTWEDDHSKQETKSQRAPVLCRTFLRGCSVIACT